MAQVAEIKFGQKVMEKETEKKISQIEGLYPMVEEVPRPSKRTSTAMYLRKSTELLSEKYPGIRGEENSFSLVIVMSTLGEMHATLHEKEMSLKSVSAPARLFIMN